MDEALFCFLSFSLLWGSSLPPPLPSPSLFPSLSVLFSLSLSSLSSSFLLMGFSALDLAHEHIIIDPFLISASFFFFCHAHHLSVWSKWTNWGNLLQPVVSSWVWGRANCVSSSAWNQSAVSDDRSHEENQGCLCLNLEQAPMFFSEAAITEQVPTVYQSHRKALPNGIRNRKHFRKQQSICLHTFNLSNSCRCVKF